MALPIRNTPEIKGKDAKIFVKRMEEAESGLRRMSPEHHARAKATYAAMIKKFPALA